MNMQGVFISFQNANEPVSIVSQLFGIIAVLSVSSICIFFFLKYLEYLYVRYYKKPVFVHFYPIQKKIPKAYKNYLSENKFYVRLSKKEKRYFEHRLTKFLKATRFVGREGLLINDKKRVQVAAIVIQLTFGMRNYMLDYVETIILYPTSFYSILNKTKNNGEFNPRSRALALSWEHFNNGKWHPEEGVNLGIHEITHALHYDAMKSSNISSELFYDTFLELEQYLSSKKVRTDIVDTKILREYAYTDKFEFLAVLIEVFMETPEKLKKKLPVVYAYVVQMLNFRYFET
ncbi:zinc-dependent peptidase [Aquimarina sp. ERC-38]|uniref:zinc-dependent peptidase n=1 Tax=Aquimarina sp. ERC-38 TaxID=2949996 RepID=UPI002246ED6F|nr:zinc-dependent peptidase [Aquimarina sp. ERC-38]UZO82532.1 zinc-dependent peptidase [Aquimarina sp. ERC-38]